jgi:hypothetical protein
VRAWFIAIFALGLAWAQFRELGERANAAHLDLAIEPLMPVRVYLFREGRPFRLSPVEALFPVHSDTYYRDRLYQRSPQPRTLEITAQGQNHFVLLNGSASYTLPPGKYRVEAYRGHFYTPASAEFELQAGQTQRVVLKLAPWVERVEEWVSGDDHIHITRGPQDDSLLLDWLRAEDLTVGNFLQLQRHMDAAVQHSFGPQGEKRRDRYTIRSGQESRAEFYGHTIQLGGRELIRPVSVGPMYGNTPEAYPWPALWFRRGRELGALVGYAHFQGSMPHSAFLMDLALGNIDFLETFQFGVLRREPWYELLNAGLKFTGIAGSDFPVFLNRLRPWPRWMPLLGPERALVKRRAGESSFEAWSRGIRSGEMIVSNGPLVEIELRDGAATARARFWRPMEKLEIVRNGEVIAAAGGDGKRTVLTTEARIACEASCWVAARATAQRDKDDPEVAAHTNPQYVLKDGKPVAVESARAKVAAQWESELAHYRGAGLRFPTPAAREEFFAEAQRALKELKRPL